MEAVPPIVITPEPSAAEPVLARQPAHERVLGVGRGRRGVEGVHRLVGDADGELGRGGGDQRRGVQMRDRAGVAEPDPAVQDRGERRRAPARAGRPRAGTGRARRRRPSAGRCVSGERGPAGARARASASTTAFAAARSASCVAGSAVTNSMRRILSASDRPDRSGGPINRCMSVRAIFAALAALLAASAADAPAAATAGAAMPARAATSPGTRPHRPRQRRRRDAAARGAPGRRGRAARRPRAPARAARRARVSATASRFSGTYATVAGKRRAHAVDATRAVLRFAAGERLELAVADDGVAFQPDRVRLAGGALPAGRRRARLAAAADQELRGRGTSRSRSYDRARTRSATRRCSRTAATPTRC